MDKKIILRAAEIKGHVLPKRCRKTQFKCLDGIGETTEEAIKNLKAKYKDLIAGCKEVMFNRIIVHDVEKSGPFITRPLMPEVSGTNIEYFELSILA